MDIFEKISNYMCGCWLADGIMKQEEYIRADREVDKMIAQMDKLGLTKETEKIIYDFIDSYVNLMSVNVNLAYKQGMKDLTAFIAGLYNANEN